MNQGLRERKALIKEKQNFLVNEVENNKDCEKKIAAVERQANRLRQQFQEEESNYARLQDEARSCSCSDYRCTSHNLPGYNEEALILMSFCFTAGEPKRQVGSHRYRP